MNRAPIRVRPAMQRLSALVVAAFSLSLCAAAGATGIDATGTWRGSATETLSCSGGNGVRNLSALMIVSGDDSGAFTAETTFSGTQTFNGVTTPFFNVASPFVGTVAADGRTTAQFQATPPIDTTGVLSDETWNLSYVTVFGVCTFHLTMTLVRGGVDPKEAPSAQVTAAAGLLSTTRSIASLQKMRIGSLFSNRAVGARQAANGFVLQGMAAGDGAAMPLGVWGSYASTDSKNTSTLAASKSERYNVLGGADVMPRDWLVAGVALGYESSDTDTRFNGGELRTTGYTVSPYVAMLLSERFLIDASAGFSVLDNRQFRASTFGGSAPVRVNSRFDSIRRFFNINASYGFEAGPLAGNLNAGYLWAKESQEGYVESNGNAVARFGSRIAQVQLGADLGYQAGSFEPFARVTVEHDISSTDVRLAGGLGQLESDTTGVVAGAGLRYFDDSGVSAQFEYSTILGRNNLSEDVLSVSVRATF